MKPKKGEGFRSLRKNVSGRVAARSAGLVVVCFCFVLAFATAAGAQQTRTLRGSVVDSAGLPIRGAEVLFQMSSETQSSATGDDGTFEIAVSAGGTLIARQPGFAPATIAVEEGTPADGVQIRLVPAPDVQRIAVSAEETDERVPPVPSSEYTIPRREMDVSGTLVLDDTLRQAPGFSLFRRSGSLSANPTSQGVSMRGIGASGASRAVVLVDGIPLNDPFGGWIYWNQVPNADIASVAVSNGAESDSYGTGALGGVINIVTRQEERSYGTVELSYGNELTPYTSFAGGLVKGPWAVSLRGQALHTDGYILVPPAQRGAVDTPAGTGDVVGAVEVSRKLGSEGRFFLGATTFAESRRNGTPVTMNNTRIPTYRTGLDWTNSLAGSFSARLYGSSEIFNQTFSSVAAGRNSESLTDRQRSPSQQIGVAVEWRRTFAGRNAVTAGVEDRAVRGHSAETKFNAAGGMTSGVDAGGRQNVVGVFAQDTWYFARNWLLTASARGDFVQNTAGIEDCTVLAAGTAASCVPLAVGTTVIADRNASAFSPRLTLLRTLPHNVSVNASFYRAFRAPTLNELYRSFRQGNTLTEGNTSLSPERLTGGEAGLSWRSTGQRVTLRGNFFWVDILNPVENVTISFTPPACSVNPSTCATITRQRQNLGEIQAPGGELAADLRLPKHMRLSAGYLYTDSTVTSYPGNPALVGLQVPEVPKNSFNVQWSYQDAKWTAALQTRFVGDAFDDDQNLLPLGRAFIVDAEISRQVTRNAEMFFAAQNLFDNQYDIALTPVANVGPPILERAGVRINFP